jgi:hypothetical protein
MDSNPGPRFTDPVEIRIDISSFLQLIVFLYKEDFGFEPGLHLGCRLYLTKL